jgi:hypothetical protein
MPRKTTDDLVSEIAVLGAQIKAMQEDIKSMQEQVTNLSELANKWKGALIVILALGGIVGWASTFASNIWKHFGGG